MNKFLKIGLVLSICFALTAIMIAPAFAQIPVLWPGLGPPEGADLTHLIAYIARVILYLIGVIAVLFLIIGGFQYITSAGNPDSIEKAKTTILYAIVGIIACLLAYAVVTYIVKALETGP